jgi:hypothetical protein
MKTLQALILALSTLLSAGCATVTPTTEKVNALQSCCVNLSEVNFEPLVVKEKRELNLTESTPVFKFQTGNSHFAAFSLQQAEPARFLRVESYLSSSYLPSATVFMPSFTFLNQSKQVTRVVENATPYQQTDFWRGGYYLVQVQLTAEDHYVVIHTNTQKIGQFIPYNNGPSSQVIMVGKAPIFIPTGIVNVRPIPLATTGHMFVQTTN